MDSSILLPASNIQSDFGPSWSDNLNTTILSNPELAIIEREAWKDQAHFRVNESTPLNPSSHHIIPSHPELANEVWKDEIRFRECAPTKPTPVDPLECSRQARWAEEAKCGLMTPPPTPRKYEREYNEEGEETDTDDEEEAGDVWFSRYTDEQWALAKYGPRRGLRGKEKSVPANDDQATQELGKVIVFYVFLAVLLHGVYTHWNESQKQDGCQCHCFQCYGLGNATVA